MGKKVYKVGCKCFRIILICIFIILFLIAGLLAFYIISNKFCDVSHSKAPIKFYTIVSPSMEPNINVYDTIISKRIDDEDSLTVGDVITFYSDTINTGEFTVTHRILNIENENGINYYTTKGDNNPEPDDGRITFDKIQGELVYVIPSIGKIQKFISSRLGWVLVIIIPALLILLLDLLKITNIFKIKKQLDSIEPVKELNHYKETEESKRVRALVEKADRINNK